MKTFQKNLLVLLVSTLFLIACNDKKTKQKPIVTPTHETSKKTTETKDSIVFKAIKTIAHARYTNNLRVVSGENESHITLDDNTIHLKFPVSNTNFKHFATYNISTTDKKAILYVITDGTQVAEQDMNYIAFTKENYKSIKEPLLLKKGEKLYVIILHDDFENQKDTYIEQAIIEAKEIVAKSNKNNNDIIPCDEIWKGFLQPKTACGGVIVDYY